MRPEGGCSSQGKKGGERFWEVGASRGAAASSSPLGGGRRGGWTMLELAIAEDVVTLEVALQLGVRHALRLAEVVAAVVEDAVPLEVVLHLRARDHVPVQQKGDIHSLRDKERS